MATTIQLSGFLYKQPFGHQSTKWSKRFFILKDGFMLYYAENEKKEFEKLKGFNIHPKGAVPLGGSTIESAPEPGHPFAIRIKNENYVSSPICVAAESEVEREKWLDMLRQSSRVTFDNAELGDSMIRQLEQQGLQMAQEKQDYFDQLQTEAKALADEQHRSEQLERIKIELEKEKVKMALMTREMSEQYKVVKLELEETTGSLKDLEHAKRELVEEAEALHLNLQDLNKEKEDTIQKLQEHHSEAMKLSKENENLNEVMESLKRNLKSIESKSNRIIDEKKKAENLLEENKYVEESLLGEKQMISERINELENSIKDLAEQKAITEAELKEEVLARMQAERRLRGAEESLQRLERAVVAGVGGGGGSGNNGGGGDDINEDMRDEEDVKKEMLGDVQTLRRFFENLAFEAKMDAEKSVMMKNTIYARKTLVRRAKTMRYEESRKQTKENQLNVRDSLGYTLPLRRISQEVDDDQPEHRSVTLALRRSNRSSEQLEF